VKHENETIIVIEYCNGLPFSVYTECNDYAFDMHANGWLMFELVGCGRNYIKEGKKKIIKDLGFSLSNPKFSYSVWFDPGYELRLTQPVRLSIIDRPIMIPFEGNWVTEKYNNPFKAGSEVNEIYYCEKCNAFYDDECPEHGYYAEEEVL
jgi:hypothetical protein